MRFGAQGLLFDFQPYDATGTFSDGGTVKIKATNAMGGILGLHRKRHKVNSNLTLEYGLRMSYYICGQRERHIISGIPS